MFCGFAHGADFESGEVAHKERLWADFFYPYFLNGLNYGKRKYDLSLLKKIEVFEKNQNVLDEILLKEQKTESKFFRLWEGYCDVVAEATTKYCLPKAGEIESENGRKVSFNSSEIRRMIYLYLTLYNRSESDRFFGAFIDTDPWGREMNYGVLPSHFHHAITHRIGKEKKPFVADLGKGDRVFNSVVVSYRFQSTRISKTETLYHTEIGYVPVLHRFRGNQDTSVANGFIRWVNLSYVLSAEYDDPKSIGESGYPTDLKAYWVSKRFPWSVWMPNSYRPEEDERVPPKFRELIKSTALCE